MVAVSKMVVAGLFFVQPGVKVNGKYYGDVLLEAYRSECYLQSDMLRYDTMRYGRYTCAQTLRDRPA